MNRSSNLCLRYTSAIQLAIVIGLTIAGCGQRRNTGETAQSDSAAEVGYLSSIEEWRAERIAALTAPSGWLNLAGLYWLEEGANSFGGEGYNVIHFPAGTTAMHLGVFILRDGSVRAELNPHAEVLVDSLPLPDVQVRTDADGEPTMFRRGRLEWYLIERNGRVGIRLRDHASPALREFKGIDAFPTDPSWALPARFEAHEEPQSLQVPNALGYTSEQSSPGSLLFERQGREYRLEVMGSGEDFFIVFGDDTNGLETYGGGRFLVVAAPDVQGMTVIDFNKAYNPPCAFTPYATCPLPPEANKLALAVRAGEKSYSSAQH